MKTKKQQNEIDYGKIAFCIIIISILIWVSFHIRIGWTSLTYYNCPGVGLQTNIKHFIGCTEAFTKTVFGVYLK